MSGTPLINAIKRCGKKAQDTGAGGCWDEALTLAAQFKLFARCGFFVGTLTSNVGRFVWEQSAAWRGTGHPPVHDMDGGAALFFSGWEGSPFPHKPFWMSKSFN